MSGRKLYDDRYYAKHREAICARQRARRAHETPAQREARLAYLRAYGKRMSVKRHASKTARARWRRAVHAYYLKGKHLAAARAARSQESGIGRAEKLRTTPTRIAGKFGKTQIRTTT